jgi:hypothetical protein
MRTGLRALIIYTRYTISIAAMRDAQVIYTPTFTRAIFQPMNCPNHLEDPCIRIRRGTAQSKSLLSSPRTNIPAPAALASLRDTRLVAIALSLQRYGRAVAGEQSWRGGQECNTDDTYSHSQAHAKGREATGQWAPRRHTPGQLPAAPRRAICEMSTSLPCVPWPKIDDWILCPARMRWWQKKSDEGGRCAKKMTRCAAEELR